VADSLKKPAVMTYLKSVAVGFAAAMLAVAAWILGQVAVVVAMLASQFPAGSGGIGAVSVGLGPWPLILAAGAFVLGFRWQWRRGRRRQRAGATGDGKG
jgi:hypothetical protein